MRKPMLCICKNKGTVTAKLISALFFGYSDSTVLLLSKATSHLCLCSWFMLDLIGNHSVGFLMKGLSCIFLLSISELYRLCLL